MITYKTVFHNRSVATHFWVDGTWFGSLKPYLALYDMYKIEDIKPLTFPCLKAIILPIDYIIQIIRKVAM